MKITVSAGKESTASKIETKKEEAKVKGRKASRDLKRGVQKTEDKAKDLVDQANLKFQQVKKRII